MRSLCTRGQGWLMALLVLGAAIGAVSCASASPDYSAVILADSPLGYWRLGESDASQPAMDASGNGNDGTYQGGVTLGQPGAIVNDPDTAAAFDGTSGYVDIPGDPFNFSNGFTLEAWVINNGQFGTGEAGRIFSNRSGAGGYGFGVLHVGDPDRLRFTTFNILDYDSEVIVPQDSAYHYVAVTLDSANTANFYLDGAKVDSISGPAPASSSSSNFNIGRNPVSPEYWNGTIDEAAVYNYVLTDAQIMAHFQAGTSP